MVEVIEVDVECSECGRLSTVKCFDFFIDKGDKGPAHPMASGRCGWSECHNWISIEETREAAKKKLQ